MRWRSDHVPLSVGIVGRRVADGGKRSACAIPTVAHTTASPPHRQALSFLFALSACQLLKRSQRNIFSHLGFTGIRRAHLQPPETPGCPSTPGMAEACLISACQGRWGGRRGVATRIRSWVWQERDTSDGSKAVRGLQKEECVDG
jgi:hypothetical protein